MITANIYLSSNFEISRGNIHCHKKYCSSNEWQDHECQGNLFRYAGLTFNALLIAPGTARIVSQVIFMLL